jgi:acetyl esterase/lipase
MMRAMRGSIFDSSASRAGPEGLGVASDRADAALVADAEPSAPRWQRWLATALAAVVTLLVFAIVLGALFPSIGWVGAFGTVLESFFSLHIFLAGVIAIALALWALRLNEGRATTVILWLAIASTAGAILPIGVLVGAAHRAGAPISWWDHLRVAAPGPEAEPDQTMAFATVDGKTLYTDIYLPGEAGSATAPSAPVVMIHGGGFSGGTRSMGRDWDRWLASRGYTVFDIDYRLDPPVTWNLAAQDVACAMAWVASHAALYNIAPNRMLITGQSAGGGLAMQVGYGLGDGTVTSSCGGAVPQPAAIFALYPPDDLAMAWNLKTGIGPVSGRVFNTGYIGGSPEDFPERYRAVSPIFHVRPGLPPTLIAAGAQDHLVPFGGHIEMADRLTAAGVTNELVSVPYGEHAYDVAWGSLGGQITRHAMAVFLARYLPATAQ